MSFYSWRPYVPVAVRRARAIKKLASLQKKGGCIQPVEIEGRKIAQTFWGQAWCDHLESFSDYENRLPRGRTYIRNGSVCHLEITRGKVQAIVIGSELYNVEIAVQTLPKAKWGELKERCAGQIGSLLELLQGRLSKNVMAVVTDRREGLFPLPGEIRLHCSCPDWAVMCKHVAAVLYGVGARLDEAPELLFLLRGVDHAELIGAEVGLAVGRKEGRPRIAEDALADLFGIEMPEAAAPVLPKRPSASAADRTPARAMKPATKAARPPKKAASDRKSAPAAAKAAPVTGKAVAALRAKFGMSQSRFARLLGVSLPAVAAWEKRKGALNLQARTLDAWNGAAALTKRQAWRRLNGS
ncbi:MAG: SWIM zinc finger family protein [Desulfobacterales bacterium]|jgi:uncharacterized Zn finger protein|nr:SWIM zinc finger family protein [Desulfobacterales bacterium]